MEKISTSSNTVLQIDVQQNNQLEMGRAFELRKGRKMKRWSAMAKTFTRIGKDIVMAIKDGGPNPDSNSRLRAVMQNAKAANMPKENVERAIKKATDKAKKNMKYFPLKKNRTFFKSRLGIKNDAYEKKEYFKNFRK